MIIQFLSVSDLEIFLGECYDFREMAEEHEDEDDTGYWGRTQFGIVRVSFCFQVKVKFGDFR